MNAGRGRGTGLPSGTVITKTKPRTKRPSLYRVLLLNDDFTPMDFVVHVLERLFHKDHEAAQRIMMTVHQRGLGECGVFTHEVAETKVMLVIDIEPGCFQIEDIKVSARYLNHPAVTLGYRLQVDDSPLVYACDHGPR
jgi:ATP-dependent Clp protease adaptor protein ClpS